MSWTLDHGLPRSTDVVLGASLGVLAGVELATADTATEHPGALLLTSLAMVLAVMWRQDAPLRVMLLVGALFAAYPIVDPEPVESLVQAVLLLVAAYSVGAHASLRPAVVGLVVAVGAGAVRSWQMGLYDVGSVVVNSAWGLVAWGIGRGVQGHERRATVAELAADNADQLRAEAEQEAAATERRRIARELHDIVAHAVTVIVVQARGGRRCLDTDPVTARSAFDAIELMAAEAVAELRRLLSVLDESGAPSAEVRSGPAELEALVERVNATGQPVLLHIEGSAGRLPTSVDVSAYRVVQEALTNAMKHGSGAETTVRVSYEADRVEVHVGSPVGQTADGDGHGLPGAGRGLAGLRERLRLVGGSLSAGEDADGRFAVHAVLPFERQPS